MAVLRLTKEERARHWNENFRALLDACRARYVEKDEPKAMVASFRGAAAMAAWDAAENGAEVALLRMDGE